MPDREAVRCPWCGAEMKYREQRKMMASDPGGNHSQNAFRGCYQCEVCAVDSPFGRWEYTEVAARESAYSAAMARYVEANRVLTWEEFLALPNKMLACREYRGDERYSPCHMWEGYGTTWRAWLRRPTDAEREEEKWG